MSRIDYSKWDHIEISDDEDDTHPNVDTPSLFKWRHEARVQRREEEKQKKAAKEAERKIRGHEIDVLRARKAKLENDGSLDAKEELEKLNEKLEQLEKDQKQFLEKEAELEKYEREHPHWDVDNISQESSNKTVINKYKKEEPQPKTEEEKAKTMSQWFKENGQKAEKYSTLTKPADSHKYLSENMELVCDHLANYLVIYCVDLAVEKKDKAVRNCARQTVQIQYIMELAKSLQRDPKECVNAFFARMATAQDEYKAAFEDEVKSLVERVYKRAKERYEEAEAEERKKRLGPAGLDPIEVLESLPEKLQRAFKEQNDDLLREGFAELTPEEMKFHYERVVGSGLWVPSGNPEGEQDADDEGDDDDDDDVDDIDDDDDDDEDIRAAMQSM